MGKILFKLVFNKFIIESGVIVEREVENLMV